MFDSLLSPPLAAALPLAGLFDSLQPWMIGVLIPVAALLFTLALIFGGLFAAHQKRRIRYDLLRLALEKGQPLPPDAFREEEGEQPLVGELGSDRKKPVRRDDRRHGLILVAVAGGLFLFLRAFIPGGLAWVAAIPGLIGLALLLNWLLERWDPPAPAPRD